MKGLDLKMDLNNTALKTSIVVFSTKYLLLSLEKDMKGNQVQNTKVSLTL